MKSKETAQERFGKAQSPTAKKTFTVRLIFHIISVPFTTWGLYQSYFGGEDVILWFLVAAFALAAGVQYAIGSQESTVARQAVWQAFPNAGSIGVFALSSLILCSLIWFNHQTSQVGRIDGVEIIIGDADELSTTPIDSSRKEVHSRHAAKLSADSLAATKTLALEVSGYKSVLASELAIVESMRKKAKSVKASHPSWSAGIYQNAAKKETEARSDYSKTEAMSKLTTARLISSYRLENNQSLSSWDSLLTADLLVVRGKNDKTRTQHEATKAIAQSSGNWIVILTSFGSFFICLLWEAYRRICGLEMEGEVYDPSAASKSPLRHFKGFLTDHIDVIDERMNKTRECYRETAKNKGAYTLPPSRMVLQFSLFVLLAYSFGQTFVFTEEDYEASRAAFSLPHPWNWVTLFFAGVGLIVTGWRDGWMKSKKATATLATAPTPSIRPTATTTPTLTPPVAPHITVPHIFGIPTATTTTPTVASPTPATLGPNKAATPKTKRKAKKATAPTKAEFKKADKRARMRFLRSWEYTQEGKIPQAEESKASYEEDKAWMESHGLIVTELPKGRLSIAG